MRRSHATCVRPASSRPRIDVGGPTGLGYNRDVPLYEYRCTACRKRVTVLTLRVGEEVHPTCDKCGSAALERMMSRFAMPRSEGARLDALSDPSSLSGLDENDPKSVGRWMRRVGGELGDELGGDELDEMVEGIESGEDACDAGGCADDGGGSDDD